MDGSIGYAYVLRRLAYVSFMNKEYAKSEKYFRIVEQIVQAIASNNPF